MKSEVINRKHFPFWSLKMGTFSVPSLKGERQFDLLIEEVGMGYDDFLIEWVVIGL